MKKLRDLYETLGLSGVFGLAVLAVVLGVMAIHGPARRPVMKPGLVMDYFVDADGNDPEHHMRIVVTGLADNGYQLAVLMPESDVNGTQTVTAADRAAGRCIRGRSWSGDNSREGCASWARISDALYRDIKSGHPAELDLQDQASNVGEVRRWGSGRVTVRIDGRQAPLSVVTAGNQDDWSITVNDDPAFPFMTDGLLEIWTPQAKAKNLIADLDWKGRVSTTALLVWTDGHVDSYSQPLIDALAAWLKAHPDRKLRVVAYTTDTLGLDERLNKAFDRSKAIAEALFAKGADRKRVQIGASPYGARKAEAPGEADRVELTAYR